MKLSARQSTAHGPPKLPRRTPRLATGPYQVSAGCRRTRTAFSQPVLTPCSMPRFPACLKASRPVFASGVLISAARGFATVFRAISGKGLERFSDTRKPFPPTALSPKYGDQLRSRLDLVGIRWQRREDGCQADIVAGLAPLVHPYTRTWLPIAPAIYPASLSWDIVLRTPLRRLRLLPMWPLLSGKLHGDTLRACCQPHIHTAALATRRHEPSQGAQYREEEH